MAGEISGVGIRLAGHLLFRKLESAAYDHVFPATRDPNTVQFRKSLACIPQNDTEMTM